MDTLQTKPKSKFKKIIFRMIIFTFILSLLVITFALLLFGRHWEPEELRSYEITVKKNFSNEKEELSITKAEGLEQAEINNKLIYDYKNKVGNAIKKKKCTAPGSEHLTDYVTNRDCMVSELSYAANSRGFDDIFVSYSREKESVLINDQAYKIEKGEDLPLYQDGYKGKIMVGGQLRTIEDETAEIEVKDGFVIEQTLFYHYFEKSLVTEQYSSTGYEEVKQIVVFNNIYEPVLILSKKSLFGPPL